LVFVVFKSECFESTSIEDKFKLRNIQGSTPGFPDDFTLEREGFGGEAFVFVGISQGIFPFEVFIKRGDEILKEDGIAIENHVDRKAVFEFELVSKPKTHLEGREVKSIEQGFSITLEMREMEHCLIQFEVGFGTCLLAL
jgi:hypothetical protein